MPVLPITLMIGPPIMTSKSFYNESVIMPLTNMHQSGEQHHYKETLALC